MFSFRDIPSVTQASQAAVGKQGGDGAHKFAAGVRETNQFNTKMDFERSEQERRKREFARTMDLNEAEFEDKKAQARRAAMAKARQELYEARYKEDPQAIALAEGKLESLGVQFEWAGKDDSDQGEEQVERNDKKFDEPDLAEKATKSEEVIPETPVRPTFMDKPWDNASAVSLQRESVGGMAPPVPLKNPYAGFAEFLPPVEPVEKPTPEQAPLPAQSQRSRLGGLFSQGDLDKLTLGPSIESKTVPTEAPAGTPALERLAVQERATGKAPELQKELAPEQVEQAAKIMGVAPEERLRVMKDESGNIIDVWGPKENRDTQEKQRYEFIDAKRNFTGAAAKAWKQAQEFEPRGNMPSWKKAEYQREAFWKFYNGELSLEKARTVANRPRGASVVNKFHQGATLGRQEVNELSELGKRYTAVRDSLKGLDSKNPILSSVAIVKLAKAVHNDRLTDKDISMMNITPSLWSKLKNVASTETAETIDTDTRLRLGEALIALESNMEREASTLYHGARNQFDIGSEYGEPGWAQGYSSAIFSAAAPFKGLARREHFGMTPDAPEPGSSQTVSKEKSSSILNRFKKR